MKNVALASVFSAAFLLFSCSPMQIRAQDDVYGIDFKNFAYPAYCAGDKPDKIIVRNGEYSKETQMDGYVDRIYFNIFGVSYGDLTGDGRDEAVVLSVCNTGGTGNFSEGYVYTAKDGKAVLLAHVPGGDRAYGGLRSAKVDNGLLVVDSNDPGENGGNCCPELAVTNRYKLSGGKLIAQGKPVRRELFPTERLSFARGTSGTTFRIAIPEDEGKRYTVGARAGQTLKVSTDSDKVSLRVLGDIDVVEGINNFAVKLPRSGDYTFEVRNDAGSNITATVNVKIE